MKKNIKNVIFDVDSTLVTIEGLDYLAKLKNSEATLVPITELAMNGQLPMREAMEAKMAILQPSFLDLIKLGEVYLKNIVPGAPETIAALVQAKITVWVITGSFQPAVGILTDYLGIPRQRVITNTIRFDEQAKYHQVDFDHPLCNNHGKAKIIQSFGNALTHTVMVGDGVTDLDTKPIVDLFIGFGGVIPRETVEKKAEVFVRERDLRAILPFIL